MGEGFEEGFKIWERDAEDPVFVAAMQTLGSIFNQETA